jgi:Flp pilus assembly protein TadG
MMVLGAIAVDFSIAFLGERELAGATAAAANDTAARAVSNRDFYRGGVVILDDVVARELATDMVRTALERYHDVRVTVTVVPGGQAVVVTASAAVDYLFARGLVGGAGRARVSATSSASLRST